MSYRLKRLNVVKVIENITEKERLTMEGFELLEESGQKPKTAAKTPKTGSTNTGKGNGDNSDDNRNT